MKIPNGQTAIVDDAKVRDYLLSPDHPVGRFKARVFIAAGYRLADWQRLKDDLLRLVSAHDGDLVRRDTFGERWEVAGDLPAPGGRPLPVRTIWLIPSEGASPRLITAYPASRL